MQQTRCRGLRAFLTALLITLRSTQDRMEAIAKKTQGFVYLVSVTGVTGVQDQLQSRVGELVTMLHSVTDKPVGTPCFWGIAADYLP